MLRAVLELEGMAVAEAADGIEALEQLSLLHQQDPRIPSIILLDWMMPRCSGDEFRRKQLSDPATAKVPVVVISAAAERQGVFCDLQPFAFVTKPFEPLHLLGVVRSALRRALAG
jgi:two-component system phosphate regulon response regulator PhoB